MTSDEARALVLLMREHERITRRAKRRRTAKKAALYALMPLVGPLAGQWLDDMEGNR